MDRNRWGLGAALCLTFCTSGCAPGQLFGPHRPLISGGPVPLTPAERARVNKTWRLEQAAIAALNAGRPAVAEADARQAVSFKSFWVADELLAAALNAQGKTQQALRAYEAVAHTGNQFQRNSVPYAVLALKTGHWAEAVNAYNDAIDQYPQAEPLRANGHFSATVPKPKEMAVALHIAQGQADIDSPVWGTPPRCDKAMSEFGQALRLAPDSPLANYYYGSEWLKMIQANRAGVDKEPQARAALQKADRLGDRCVKSAAEESLQLDDGIRLWARQHPSWDRRVAGGAAAGL